jgi:hypothetical protein
VNVPPPTFKHRSHWSHDLLDLVDSVLVRDVQTRKSARELLKVWNRFLAQYCIVLTFQHKIVVNCDFTVMEAFCLDSVRATLKKKESDKDSKKEEKKKKKELEKESKKQDKDKEGKSKKGKS